MKKILKNNIGEIITFFTTILILVVVFDFVNLNKDTILISDLKSQMYPLLEYFKLFFTGEIGFYNFAFGLGDTFLGTFYYYLSSPFNFLVFLFKDIGFTVYLIVILKSAFSSLFCYKYLKYQNKINKMSLLISFSLMYGLSSYFIRYHFFIQFLDVYMMLPLVLLGIDKIIKEKNYLLYAVSLMLTILFNYYFAFMVCVFSFLYFNYKTLINKIKFKDWLKKNYKFIFVSFLICLAMSFVLLPIMSEIGNYSRDHDKLFGGESLRIIIGLFDIIDIFLLGNVEFLDMLNEHSFYLYSSITLIPLIYLYFTNKKIRKREKKFTGIMILIMIISVSINYVNYFWHGLMPPNFLNGRYTFIFILFMIYIGFKSALNISSVKFKNIIIAIVLIFIAIVIHYIMEIPFNFYSKFIINFMFLIIYSIIILFFIKKVSKNKKLGYLIFYSAISVLGIICLIFRLFNFLYFLRLLVVPALLFLGEYFLSKRKFNLKEILFILFSVIFLIFSIYILYLNRYIINYMLFIKLLILVVCFVFIYLVGKFKFKIVNLLLVFIFIFELGYNSFNYLYCFDYKIDERDNTYEEIIKYIKKDNSPFYRIEDNDTYTSMNNSILYNYRGTDLFLSSIKEDFHDFFFDFSSLDNYAAQNCVFFDGSNHLLASLLNMRYFIDLNKIYNSDLSLEYVGTLYEKIESINNFDIYYNPYALELGYMVDSGIVNFKKQDNGLENINSLYKSMTNSKKDIFKKIEVSKIDNGYSFTNEAKKDIYILINFDEKKYDKILSSDESIFSFFTDYYEIFYKNNIIMGGKLDNVYKYDNDFKLNEVVNFDLLIDEVVKECLDINFYYYDEDVFKEYISMLQGSQLNISKADTKSIEGNINVVEDGIMFLSCIYDKNLDVYIDGVKQDKIKLVDAFIGVEVEKGNHTVKIKYNPRVFVLSLIPSLIGFLSLIYLYLRNKKLIKFSIYDIICNQLRRYIKREVK